MSSEWVRAVQNALRDGDTETLIALFAAALAAEGHTAAAHSWLAAVSAFDADAQTG